MDRSTATDGRRTGLELLFALPRHVLFLLGGVAAVGTGGVVAFGPPLVGLPAPTYPDPTGLLALAGLCSATGCGLLAGGVVLWVASLVR